MTTVKNMEYVAKRVDEIAEHYLRRFFGDGRWRRIYAAVRPGVLAKVEDAPDDTALDAWELISKQLAVVCDEAIAHKNTVTPHEGSNEDDGT